ncbi:S-4TM family putative pore-forming effector [Mycobacterium sp. 155]|uniref:S-4TM family putative pore-forming effector n=1 Tax=Mycobacterium sp. 155 TaxID=1157943 RepID=UPI0003779E56|nr:S-4TM family putative pore-forming effector [Mycobacterium sp. 155]
MTDIQLKSRQTEPAAQRYLQASLFCDHRSSRWDVAVLIAAIAVPIIQTTCDDSWFKTALQWVLAMVVFLLLWTRDRWKERGRQLRNEFEYYVYDIQKPYTFEKGDDAEEADDAVGQWQEGFQKERAKLPERWRQDTSTWFFEKSTPPTNYLDQIKAAQLESLEFGRDTRRLWGFVTGFVCLAVVGTYAWVEQGAVFRSESTALGTVAVIAIVSAIGKVAVTAFSHAGDRTKLENEVEKYDPASEADPLCTERLAILQERISAARKSRVVVPLVIYWSVKWWTDRRKNQEPCAVGR